MAKTSNLYVRIEPEVKEQAEIILNALGIPASNAINMFYKQIIAHRGIPFDLKLPQYEMPDASQLTGEQLNSELEIGYAQMCNGDTISSKEAFDNIRKDYNL